MQTDILSFVDSAVRTLVPGLVAFTGRLLSKNAVVSVDPEKVGEVVRSFQRERPYDDVATLPEIATAGWLFLRGQRGYATVGEAVPTERRLRSGSFHGRRYAMLQDLMLKSLEVSEWLRLTEAV
jgi:hypothetical protein